MNDGTVWFSARPTHFPDNEYYVYRMGPNDECPVRLPLFPAPGQVFGNYPNCNPNEPHIALIDIELVAPVPSEPQNRIVVMVKYVELAGNCSSSRNYPIFFHSDDGGDTWDMAGPLPADDLDLEVTTVATRSFAVSKYNPDVLYLNIGTCIQKSEDGGVTFSPMNSIESHVDLRFVQVYDGDMTGDLAGLNDQVYIATDGGISKTEIRADGQVHLKDITGEGMACTNNFGLGITEKNSDLIFTGAQDGSINFYNEGEWFETTPGGDNGDALIRIDDITGEIRVFQESQNYFYEGEINGTGTNVDHGPRIIISEHFPTLPAPDDYPDRTRWTPLIFNSDKTEMFGVSKGLYTSTDDGNTWTPIATGLEVAEKLNLGTGRTRLGNIGMSSGDDNVIYFCKAGFFYDTSAPLSLGNSGGMFRVTRDDINSDWEEVELLNLDLDLGVPISDIAVDPDNSDIVWITLGSFVEGRKVYKSENGGVSWTNESGCLPNVPFSSIICQGGGSDQIYAGSDFGLYYKDNTLGEGETGDWIFYADGPRALISDMEINRCANKIVVATMGLGLWEVDLVKGAPTVIAENTSSTWDTDRSLYGDLIIEDGATLAINNSIISISRLVNIIVEQGGTLVINNSTLTNGCGDLWEGIDVWGNASQHQFAQSGSYLQGRLEVKNNSIIEYARTAVKLAKDDDEENLFTGGIINANNATFRNNQTGIRFNPFTNTVPAPNAPVFGNASSITDCTFITDEPLPEGLNPIAFISLWGVDDIPIARSNFSNESAAANTTAALGKGIYAQDASFIVSGGENVESTFTNLSHGVHAQSAKSMRNFTVDYVNFENCNNGVYFSAVNFAKITRSFFNFGNTPNGAARTYGIVNESSTGFQIEENEFSTVQEVNSSTIGTLMAFTGIDNNQIYNNKFTGLNYANWAIGDNAASGFGDGENTGLLYQCNTQNNSLEYDINVLYGRGIRVLQGSVDQFLNYFPARNTFSNTGNNTWSDIAVIGGSTNNMNYVYGPGASEEPLFVTSSKVNKTQSNTNNTDGCQSSFGKPNEKEVKKTEYNGTNEKYTTRKQSYSERVDNGNTEYFLNQITIVNPNNQNLKNQLLAASPYVSTEVLEKIVETGAFTQSSLYSILKANPDAVRQSGLLEVSSVPSSLNTAQFQELEQNAGNMTERGEMELLLTSLKAEKDRYANELVHIYLEEERNSAVNQEIVSWLETTESLATTYAKVDLLFETGARTEARNLFLTVPQLFSLNVEENLEYQDLRTLYQLLYQLPANARNEAYFTESEYETVDGLAVSGNGKARSKARNIMEFFYGKIYPLEFPEQANLNETPTENNLEEIENLRESDNLLSLVTVSPNPASTVINIRYLSPSLYGNQGEILVISFYGQTLFQESIDAKEKNISLNVESWPSGMYYCIYKSSSKKKRLIPFFINH